MRYILSVLCLACSCNTQSELSQEARTRVASEIRTMLQRYDDEVRANGLLSEFAYLDSSDDFFWVPPGYSLPLSYDSVSTILRRNAGGLRMVDNMRDSLLVIPHSEFLATLTGALTSRIEGTTGNVTTVRLIETGLAVKRPEGWKLLSGQTTVIE